MPFLHFISGEHEWGFTVSDWCIPSIGDTVTLWHSKPNDGDAEDATSGIITNRAWGFASDYRLENKIYFEVQLESELPDGHVADSTEWPAKDEAQRALELKVRLDKIRRGRPLND